MSDKPMRFATRAIHGGQHPDPLTGAVMPPIYATSTYVQSSPGVHKGYDYSRTRNPTRDALQAALCNLEGGGAAFAFASGMAASSTVLELLDAGSHIVAMHDLYGGTYRLLENVRKRSAGHAGLVRRSDPARGAGGCGPSQHAPGLGGDAQQSAAAARRSGGGGCDCALKRTDQRLRQYVRHALRAAAARARLRYRGAFDHEVSERSFRLRGRGGHRARRQPAGGARRLPAERTRRRPGAVRLVSDFTRHQDAGAAHGAALRQRSYRGAVPRQSSRRSSASTIRACRVTPSMR